MSSDELGGGAVEEPVIETSEESVNEPAVPSTATAAPAGLTAEDIRRETQAAIREAQEASERKLADAQRQQQTVQHRQAIVDPVEAALEVADMRDDLMDEIREMYPDLPKESMAQIKGNIRKFKSVAALQAAKSENLHKLIAHAAFGEAVHSGKIQVKGTEAPRREPVGGGAPVKQMSEREQFESLIRETNPGFKMTDEEYARYSA